MKNHNKERFKKNIITLGFISMLISNLGMLVFLYKKDSKIILLPTIASKMEISSNEVSGDYLRLRAIEVHSILFGMNRGNYEKQIGLLKELADHGGREGLNKQLIELSEDIEEKGYHYHFSDIVEYKIESESNKVSIIGYLETYLGEKKVNRELKNYEYRFINHSGRVMLLSIKEGEVEDV